MNRFAANNRRFAILMSATIALLSAGTAAIAAPMPVNPSGILAPIYMNLEDIKGDVQETTGKTDALKVDQTTTVGDKTKATDTPTESMSLNFTKIETKNAGQSTGGAGAGKVEFNEFQITKTTDKASPDLFKNTVQTGGSSSKTEHADLDANAHNFTGGVRGFADGSVRGAADGSVDIPLDNSSSESMIMGGASNHSVNGDGHSNNNNNNNSWSGPVTIPAVQNALNMQDNRGGVSSLQRDLQNIGNVLGGTNGYSGGGGGAGFGGGGGAGTNGFTGGVRGIDALSNPLNLGSTAGGAIDAGKANLLLPAIQPVNVNAVGALGGALGGAAAGGAVHPTGNVIQNLGTQLSGTGITGGTHSLTPTAPVQNFNFLSK